MTGLLIIHDVLEQIVGEMPQHHEIEEQYIVRRDDSSWLVDGLLQIEDFKEHFNIDELPGEDREHYQTLGDLSPLISSDIPKATDVAEWEGLRIEVLDMDRARVDKLLVTAASSNEDDDRDF